jgi:hypothetical protein
MPIDWSVDDDRHCLQAHFSGALTWQEIMEFQTSVSLAPQYLGYLGYLVIASSSRFPVGSATDPVQLIARRAAARNGPTSQTRLAIVAQTDMAFGIVRMYMAFRELAGSTRPVGLFRDEAPAQAWLFGESTDTEDP